MSNFNKVIYVAVAVFALAACGNSEKAVSVAELEGVIASSASSEVVLQKLDVNEMVVLDTLTTDAEGRFTYSVEVEEGQPEFVYVYADGGRVASLLLQAGDKVSLTLDPETGVEVKGSEESAKLMMLDKEHAAVLADFAQFNARMESASEKEQKEILGQMGKRYQQYYRASTKYVLENPKSMTVVPVLYRRMGDLLLFSQSTDAIIFSNIADSLETVYPSSKYVKALRAEADRRYADLELAARLSDAEVVGYFDMTLPDLDGKMQTLSELESKVTILMFWSASDPAQNAFNVDVLKPLYADYHKKGLEIYQVSLDSNKAMWATTIMGQNLPWVSVCDIRGLASPYVTDYNLPSIPAAFIIADGELVDGQIVDMATLRKLLDKLLK